MIVQLCNKSCHRGLAGTGISGKDQMIGDGRHLHAALLADLCHLDEIHQAVNILLYVFKSHQSVQLRKKALHGLVLFCRSRGRYCRLFCRFVKFNVLFRLHRTAALLRVHMDRNIHRDVDLSRRGRGGRCRFLWRRLLRSLCQSLVLKIALLISLGHLCIRIRQLLHGCAVRGGILREVLHHAGKAACFLYREVTVDQRCGYQQVIEHPQDIGSMAAAALRVQRDNLLKELRNTQFALRLAAAAKSGHDLLYGIALAGYGAQQFRIRGCVQHVAAPYF